MALGYDPGEELVNAPPPTDASPREEAVRSGRPMHEAPKSGKPILLCIPDGNVLCWWVGNWSGLNERWVVRTPYRVDGRMVIVPDMDAPVKWAELPET